MLGSTRKSAALLATAALMLAGSAFGAEPVRAPEQERLADRPTAPLRVLHRGFYVGLQSGALLLLGPDSANRSPRTSVGRSMELLFGWDLSDSFGVGLLLLGATIDTPADFRSPTGMRGDFMGLGAGPFARVALARMEASDGEARFLLWARGGAAFTAIQPGAFYEAGDLLLFGGPALEYFTRLRHFSLALEADLLMGTADLGLGLKLAPSVRYTF